MTPEQSDTLARFLKEMENVDEAAHVLLKGHLLIEERLTSILELYLFHREHLRNARLTFHQKALLSRALCLRKDQFGEWELLAAVNALRNEVAHRLNSEEREKKFARVKELYFREAVTASDDLKKQSDAAILVAACAHCLGFLASFESDSKEYRKLVHTMDRTLNKDLPEFEM